MITKKVKEGVTLTINGVLYPAGGAHEFTELQVLQYAACFEDDAPKVAPKVSTKKESE